MDAKRIRRVRIAVVLVAVVEAFFLLLLWRMGEPLGSIPAVAAIIGLPTALILLMYQLSVQHELSLEQQRDAKRLEIKHSLYSEICDAVSHAHAVQAMATIDARFLPTRLRTNIELRGKFGESVGHVRDRAIKIGESNVAAINSITRLITIVERHLIVNPRFRVFQLAFNEATGLIHETFPAFHQQCCLVLPMDLPNGEIRPAPSSLSEDNIAHIERLATAYADALDLAGCYVHDFLVEMQNELLGDVFDQRVPRREPIDPQFRVISVDQESVDEYTDYFYRQTEAGKRQRQAEEKARRVAKGETAPV